MSAPERWQLERYLPLLRVLARRLSLDKRLQARFGLSDVVQETLLRAHKGLDQFHGQTENELIGWLQTILANTANDMRDHGLAGIRDPAREQKLRAAVAESSIQLAEFLVATGPSPSEQAERHELLLRVAEAIEGLPENQRTVVIQRDMLGASRAEIAHDLGCTEKSIAGLLLRGRSQLRKSLKDL